MRNGDKKITNVYVRESENSNGQLRIEERDYSYRLPVEPEFVKMYAADVATLNGIKGVPGYVLRFMACMMDYENKVVLSASERKRWALELDVSYPSINNAVSVLVKKGFILKTGSGEYEVCSTMFSKGDWKKTMQKRESFDAYFTIRYEKTKAGYTRTVREATVKPIGMKIDQETGEVLYKYKKGGEFEGKRHEDSADLVEDTLY